MKKLNRIFYMLFLCMMVSTLTVYADDRSFDGGGGVTFEGSMDVTVTPTPGSTPQDTGGTKDKDTASSGKSSLPQTGQRANQVLPAAGCGVLLLVCWWSAEKYRGHKQQRKKVPVSD